MNETCYLSKSEYIYYKDIVIYSCMVTAGLIGLCIVRMVCR